MENLTGPNQLRPIFPHAHRQPHSPTARAHCPMGPTAHPLTGHRAQQPVDWLMGPPCQLRLLSLNRIRVFFAAHSSLPGSSRWRRSQAISPPHSCDLYALRDRESADGPSSATIGSLLLQIAANSTSVNPAVYSVTVVAPHHGLQNQAQPSRAPPPSSIPLFLPRMTR
jgi:hypothetical protein